MCLIRVGGGKCSAKILQVVHRGPELGDQEAQEDLVDIVTTLEPEVNAEAAEQETMVEHGLGAQRVQGQPQRSCQSRHSVQEWRGSCSILGSIFLSKKIFRGFYATGTIAHRVEGQVESQGIGSLLLEGEIAFASWKT